MSLSIYVIWGILLHCSTFFLFFYLFLGSQDIRQKDNTLEKENKKIYQELNRMLELISKFPEGDRKSYEISRFYKEELEELEETPEILLMKARCFEEYSKSR